MHLHMPLLASSVHYLYNALRNIIIIIIIIIIKYIHSWGGYGRGRASSRDSKGVLGER